MTETGIKKVALVTGAGSGIGRACALKLLEHGYSVVLAGRRQAPLDAVVQEAQQLGGDALAVACDVTNADSVTALFETIRARRAGSTCCSTTRVATVRPSISTNSISTNGARWSTPISPACSCARARPSV